MEKDSLQISNTVELLPAAPQALRHIWFRPVNVSFIALKYPAEHKQAR